MNKLKYSMLKRDKKKSNIPKLIKLEILKSLSKVSSELKDKNIKLKLKIQK